MSEPLTQMSDDQHLRNLGYEPQLDRSMGAWSSLSISISCMCVTAGVFTTYAYAMGKVGPAFVWTWLIVSVGQILVGLVLAELSSSMPISGYAYQWASRLVNSHYGWFVGAPESPRIRADHRLPVPRRAATHRSWGRRSETVVGRRSG